MKMKNFNLLLGLLLLYGVTFAKKIDEQTAQRVGSNFISQKYSTLENAKLELAYKYITKSVNSTNDKELVLFYVFNVSENGFVIVSGDDNLTPIIAYSNESLYDISEIPANVVKWIEGYKKQARDVIVNKINATQNIKEYWAALTKGAVIPYSSTTSVGALMQTTWNQSPYYNAQCPSGSVTGCVATAMAQVMKYWNYPTTGSGFHSYNHATYGTLSANFGSTTYQWSSMPNNVTSSNSAVATLMYQVGVSVDMNYSPQSSGAYVISSQSPVTNCSEYALKTYFGYKSTLQGVERSNYSQTQWMNLLKGELNASRPIIYAGFGSGGGHCFVADGYDNSDYVHFNWGWGGYYDGYFSINALNPNGTGTGGGSGGYNSGHQAIIGVEPPSGTGGQTFDLVLYDYVNLSASTIYYGQSFSVNTNIANNGSNTFSGDYAAAAFDSQGNFVDFVEVLTGYTLQGGYAYTNNLVFSNSGLLSLLPATYQIAIFYKPTGGNWQIVSNGGSYSNSVTLTVVNPNDIELNSTISVSPASLHQGSSISVNFNIVNDGSSTFYGVYDVSLYNLDGTFAQTIGAYTESTGLPSGYTYNSPYITLTNSNITVAPGTYLLAVMHNPNNNGWQLTGSTYNQNPIMVTVKAANLQADMYEVNNSVSQAYALNASFGGNSATVKTTGSNCHIVTDNDYYKIVLPSGYDYTISPRVHDSYSSGDGNTYTLDVLFSYSFDGTNWSDPYDDVLASSVTINGGGVVYFHVAPYFLGDIGTYLLDVPISRSAASGVDNASEDNIISIYPNPAKAFFIIDLSASTTKVNKVDLYTISGKFVRSITEINQSKIIKVDALDISEGVYFIQMHTDDGILTKRITIIK